MLCLLCKTLIRHNKSNSQEVIQGYSLNSIKFKHSFGNIWKNICYVLLEVDVSYVHNAFRSGSAVDLLQNAVSMTQL